MSAVHHREITMCVPLIPIIGTCAITLTPGQSGHI
jgi:hypothetical protein